MSTLRSATALLLVALAPPALAGFAEDFTGATLRVEYFHTGTATEEHLALRGVRVDGPWPGSRTGLLDSTNLGKYLVEVADLATNRLLYSRGFASIYGEWETTAEAHDVWQAIEEAVRVPEPRRPFQLRLRKRGQDQSFREIWTLPIDPASRFVDRPKAPAGDVVALEVHGEPAVKADLVVLGDGYAATERDLFLKDATAAKDALFAAEPFRARRADFNVRAVFTPAGATGVTRPRAGVFLDTPLGTRYNTFDSERYVLTLEDRRWRDAAAAAPYDFVLILVNERQYGGGGIFGLYSTAAARSAFAPYLVVHEFGHHLAGLADEYYTSEVAYEPPTGPRQEPWEPNVTALTEPGNLKWRDLVGSDMTLPTPWGKADFETTSRGFQARRKELHASGAPDEQLEALFLEERGVETRMLSGEPQAGKVGAFEGAMYESQGLYRPQADCVMFTRDEVGFCAVCRRAIERVIDQHSR